MLRDSIPGFARFLLLALVTAVLAGCAPSTPAPQPSRNVAPGSTTTGGSDAETAEMVSLRVPTMHCPFACWPKIKETLEKQEGVDEVTLAKQVNENEIDTPVVHVRVASTFDSAKAVEALAAAGFDDAVVE